MKDVSEARKILLRTLGDLGYEMEKVFPGRMLADEVLTYTQRVKHGLIEDFAVIPNQELAPEDVARCGQYAIYVKREE